MTSRGSTIGAAIVALVGLVWTLQGLGAPIGGGFMVGDLRWTVAGLTVVALAAAWAWRIRRAG